MNLAEFVANPDLLSRKMDEAYRDFDGKHPPSAAFRRSGRADIGMNRY